MKEPYVLAEQASAVAGESLEERGHSVVSKLGRRVAPLALIGIGVLSILLAGCGGGGGASSAPVAESRLREARKAGEEAAHEKDRVDSLERQVRKLGHQVRHSQRTPDRGTGSATPTQSAGQPEAFASRQFHVASGNVSCEVRAEGAICTVEAISETFAFTDGEAARRESGAALPKDLGEVVPYGTTVAVGSVSCEVPPSDVPRGIVCIDSAGGHGFEASRVAGRQKTY